jgi:hypothetical protein
MLYPVWRRHMMIIRHAAHEDRRRRATEEGGNFLLRTASDALAHTVRARRPHLFRDSALVLVTWFAFIAIDFKLAVDHPVEAGLIIGMAAVLYRHSRKRYVRELAERLRTRLLLAD